MPRVQIRIGPQSHAFDADRDRALLDQALERGIPLSYSCRRGDCGQCLGKIVAGEVASLNPKQACHEEGDALLCNAIALTDLAIELPYYPELDAVPLRRSPCKIHELKPLSSEVMEVSLRLPPATEFRFLPGQFVRLSNKARTTRSYSLAAPADAGKLLRIHVRRVEQGVFSRYLFEQARPGDLLQLEGPQGLFFCRDADSSPRTIFLATGTGIAPIYAMLAAMTPERRMAYGRMELYWGNRLKTDEYLRAPLLQLAETLALGYFALYSREPDIADAPRHVQQLMAARHDDLAGCLVFACGAAAMIDEARRLCLAMGLLAERFRSDPFTAS